MREISRGGPYSNTQLSDGCTTVVVRVKVQRSINPSTPDDDEQVLSVHMLYPNCRMQQMSRNAGCFALLVLIVAQPNVWALDIPSQPFKVHPLGSTRRQTFGGMLSTMLFPEVAVTPHQSLHQTVRPLIEGDTAKA